MRFEELARIYNEDTSRTLEVCDVQEYVATLKLYPENAVDHSGLCLYVRETHRCEWMFSYDVWQAMSATPGSIAFSWDRHRRHDGGVTHQRLAMCAHLIAELETMLADYENSQQ